MNKTGQVNRAKTIRPDGFGWKCARTLQSAVKHLPRKKRISLIQWAGAFTRMPSDLGIRKNKILEVLEWFCRNITEQFTPRADSPSTFRGKFDQIQIVMKRQTDLDLSGSIGNPELMKEALQVQQLTGDLIWQKDEKKDELSFIQISLGSYRKFLADLEAHRARLTTIDQDSRKRESRSKSRPEGLNAPKSILERLALTANRPLLLYKITELEWLQCGLRSDPIEEVSNWLSAVHSFAQDVESWDGHLLSMVWQRNHKWIRKECNSILRRYDHEEDAYDRLLKEMEELKTCLNK